MFSKLKSVTISTSAAIALALAGILASPVPSTLARQLSDGTVFFEKAPRLLDAYSTFSSVRIRGAKYYFTIELPVNAGEPLQKVIIRQRRGEENIRFLLEDTFAFEGTPDERGQRLSLQTVNQNPETKEMAVIFDPPIPPGAIFTVGLKPRRNPRYGGVYLFGVTVFPAGEQSYGLYLGPGRFHFYQNGNGIN